MIRKSHNKILFSLMISSIYAIFVYMVALYIPPFQSNDEFDHIERSYLLSKGVIFLSLKNNNPSRVEQVKTLQELSGYDRINTGGLISHSLYTYMADFEALTMRKNQSLSPKDLAESKKIVWNDKKVYRTAPGTSIYFPLIYVPQAMGFMIGEYFKLSVHTTYFIIKVILIFCIWLILLLAFYHYPCNPLVIFLLFLPKTIYQFASPTIDGLTTAMAILSISIFLKIINSKHSNSLFYLLNLLVFIVSTCRLHFFPFWIALFYYAYKEKGWHEVFIVLGVMISSLVWYMTVIMQGVLPSNTGQNTLQTMFFYFTHLDMLWEMVVRLVCYKQAALFYLYGLVAEVGWFSGGSFFPPLFYQVTIQFFTIIFLMSFSLKKIKQIYPQVIILLVSGMLSIVIVLLAMLFTYTPLSSDFIMGVQGRYFLLPLLCFAYAIGGNGTFSEGWRRKIGIVFLSLYAIYSVASLCIELINRFYS